MITTKKNQKQSQMTPEERKQKVNLLKKEHEAYFNTLEIPEV
jgi:hypothetical protein